MFLRILGGFVLLVALLWVVMYATAASALRDAKDEPWPYGLGTVSDLEARHDTRGASSEAKEVARLIDALDVEDASPEDYVAAQIAKRDDAVDPPPRNAGLNGHDVQIAELVRVAVNAGDVIVWGHDGLPWQTEEAGQMLAAAALERARNGDAAGAWERLHALWILARATAAEPYSAESALKMKRAANAVARKLAAPAPPWVAELSAVEPRRETAALIQQETASRIRMMPKLPGPFIILRPLSQWAEASEARRSRAAAESMTKSPRCRIDTTQDFVHPGDVYRAARIEAELEATAKMIALKNERARLGSWPPALAGAGTSRCSENHWIYTVTAGGRSMTLRMSWEVAAEPDVKHAPALDFAY